MAAASRSRCWEPRSDMGVPCKVGNRGRSWVAHRGSVNLQGLLHPWARLRSAWAALVPDVCLLCDARAGPIPNLCSACGDGLVRLPYSSRMRMVAFAYTAPISTLVHWMKFEANLPAALTLGTLLAETVADSDLLLPDAILPVPLHRSRLRERGFNQALELARPVSRRLGRPLLSRACVRVQATRPQSSLKSQADRRRNVTGAFRVCKPLMGLGRVAIVDDVLTTGATVQELARTLRRAGVRQVVVWACAGRPEAGVRRRGSPPTRRSSR